MGVLWELFIYPSIYLYIYIPIYIHLSIYRCVFHESSVVAVAPCLVTNQSIYFSSYLSFYSIYNTFMVGRPSVSNPSIYSHPQLLWNCSGNDPSIFLHIHTSTLGVLCGQSIYLPTHMNAWIENMMWVGYPSIYTHPSLYTLWEYSGNNLCIHLSFSYLSIYISIYLSMERSWVISWGDLMVEQSVSHGFDFLCSFFCSSIYLSLSLSLHIYIYSFTCLSIHSGSVMGVTCLSAFGVPTQGRSVPM